MIIEKKIKQQKTTSINEMAFVASTGASTGLITPAISISDIKYLSSAYKNSLKTVEIGGVEPPRLGVISPASQPAIPTAGLLVEDSIKAGQTNYYKAVIAYPADSRGEFFIEAFGDQGGYGLLDPYYDSGLVGYWSFNGPDIVDNGGVLTALDRSGQGNNATSSGANLPTKTIGQVGQALNFDGNDDRLLASGYSGFPTGDFTTSLWVKPNGPAGGAAAKYLLAKDYSGLEEFVVEVRPSNGAVGVRTNNILTLNGTLAIATSTWTHVVATRSGSTIYVYINNIRDSVSGTDGVALSFDGCPLYIGASPNGTCSPGGGTAGFNGLIDEVRIYNRALSADRFSQPGRTRLFQRH